MYIIKNIFAAHRQKESTLMDLNKIACRCYDITNGMIKEAVDNGANTLDEVAAATGMGNACGICLNDLQRRIDYFIEERDK